MPYSHDGSFRALETRDGNRVMQLFREWVLSCLVERHAISEQLVRRRLAWRHPGRSEEVSAIVRVPYCGEMNLGLRDQQQPGTGVLFAALALLVPVAALAKSPPGVVVEAVEPGSSSARAGLRPGDVLRWARTRGGSAELHSPFDVEELRLEEFPRGALTLVGARESEAAEWTLEPGRWGLQTRAWLSSLDGEDYAAGRRLQDEGADAEGLQRWRSIAKRGRDAGDRALLIWIQGEIATALVRQRQFETALESLTSAITEARVAGLPRAVSSLERSRAALLRRAGRIEDARRAYLGVVRERQSVDASSLAAASALQELAGLEWDLKNVGAAEAHWREALAVQQLEAPGSLVLAKTLRGLGRVALERGDVASAGRYAARASALAEGVEPGGWETAQNLTLLANIAYERGDLATVYAYDRQALAIHERVAAGTRELAYSLNNLGVTLLERGDLLQAESLLLRALALKERMDASPLSRASTMMNLASIAEARGDWDANEDLNLRALRLQEAVAPESRDVANTLNNLGIAALRRGDYDACDDFYRRALSLRERLRPGSTDVAVSLVNLGGLALERGELHHAREYFERALGLLEELAPGGVSMAQLRNNLGELELAAGDPAAAEVHLLRALAIFDRLAPTSAWSAETLHNLGSAYRQLGRLDDALRVYRLALDGLGSQRKLVGGSPLTQSTWAARYSPFYHDTRDLLLARDRGEEAFAVVERYRARTLLSMLAERDVVFEEDIPVELDRRRRQADVAYERGLSRLVELSESDDTEARAILESQLAATRREQEAVRAEIRAASPRLAALQYPEPLGLEAARAALDPGTLLLSYSIGEERSVLFAVSADRAPLAVFSLEIGEAGLRDAVRRFGESLRRGRVRTGAGRLRLQGERLSRLLLAPVAEAIAQAERLLILPDGPLHFLPFAALADPNGGGYLVEARPLHVAASATVFAELKRDRRARAALSVAALGDPVYPVYPESGAPEGASADLVRALSQGWRLRPLPGTRREVEAIGRLYPERSHLYLGSEAREERVKAIGADVSLLHIAGHGFVDDRQPLSSFLALSIPDRWREGEDNGLLQAWEIFEQVRLDAELVTLSACESALGRELAGEGMLSLARAFHYAGARTVLASLWSVSDRSTALLMERFYGYLLAGKSKDQALRQAQIELLSGPVEVGGDAELGELDATHPFHWAGFTLIGDWQ